MYRKTRRAFALRLWIIAAMAVCMWPQLEDIAKQHCMQVQLRGDLIMHGSRAWSPKKRPRDHGDTKTSSHGSSSRT